MVRTFCFRFGDVPKWLKGPHSKCGRSGNRRESSNLSISVTNATEEGCEVYFEVTIQKVVSREVFWHVFAKIPRHTSQNAITEGDLKCILTRNCEGTEQLHFEKNILRNLFTLQCISIIGPVD